MKFDKSLSTFLQRSDEAVYANLALVDRLFVQYDQLTQCVDNISAHGLTPATEQLMRSIPDVGRYMHYSQEQFEAAKPAVKNLMAMEGFFEVLGDIVSKIFNAIIAVFQWIISMIGKVISYIFGGVAAGGLGGGNRNNTAEAKALTKKLEDILKTNGTKLVGDLPADIDSIELVLRTISNLGTSVEASFPNPFDAVGPQNANRITIPGYEKNKKFLEIMLPGMRSYPNGDVTESIAAALPDFYDKILREWNATKGTNKLNASPTFRQNSPVIDPATGDVNNRQLDGGVDKKGLPRYAVNMQNGFDSIRNYLSNGDFVFAKLYVSLFTALYKASKAAGTTPVSILPAVNSRGEDISTRIEDEVDKMFSSYVKSILEGTADKKNKLGNILSEKAITANKSLPDPITADNTTEEDYLSDNYNNVVRGGTDVADLPHYGIKPNDYLATFTKLYTLIGDPTDSNRYRFAAIRQNLEDLAKTQETNRKKVEAARQKNIKANERILAYLDACIIFATNNYDFPAGKDCPSPDVPQDYKVAGDMKLKIDLACAYSTSINIRHINKFLNTYYTTVQKLIKLTATYTARYEALIKVIQDTPLANMTVGGHEIPAHSTK